MSVDELLLSDAARVAATVDSVDVDDLLRRVVTRMRAPEPDKLVDPVQVDCQPPAEQSPTPLEEVRHHLRHALSSPACARRAAELFELLGHDKEAAICWRSAASGGDPDARDYVAEFIAPPTRIQPAGHEHRQMQQLAEAYQ